MIYENIHKRVKLQTFTLMKINGGCDM